MKKKLLLYGFGIVGKGFLNHFLESQLQEEIECIGIIVKNPDKHSNLSFQLCKYGSDEEKLLFQKADILIECTNDFEEGVKIIQSALENHKVVISASKKVLAEKLELWKQLLKNTQGVLLFEAAAAASIPIFRILNHHFLNEKVLSIQGILNGTSNFILTKMENDNLDYLSALNLAKNLGYAELNPYLDVSGWDTAYKMILLALLGLGIQISTQSILVEGIQNIRFRDIFLAKECGFKIKLLATCGFIENHLIFEVIPHFIDKNSFFYTVNEANNGIIVNYEKVGEQFYYGKGAGSNATGSAIMGDLSFYLKNFNGYCFNQNVMPGNLSSSNGFFYLSIHQFFDVFCDTYTNQLDIIHQDPINHNLLVNSSLEFLIKIKNEFLSPIQIIKISNEKILNKILHQKKFSNLLL